MLVNFTNYELAMLRGSRDNEFSNALEDGNTPWVFAVVDASGLPPEVARGVLSSLVKKEIVEIEDYEGAGNSDDMMFCFTPQGRQLAIAALASSDSVGEKEVSMPTPISLDTTIANLVLQIQTYQSDTYSGLLSQVTLEEAQLIASLLIRDLFFDMDGTRGAAINGTTLSNALTEVRSMLKPVEPDSGPDTEIDPQPVQNAYNPTN